MKPENRVIHRIGARELTLEEMEKIKGGFITFSVCTFANIYYSGSGDDANHDGC